jgi:hypothetical protein
MLCIFRGDHWYFCFRGYPNAGNLPSLSFLFQFENFLAYILQCIILRTFNIKVLCYARMKRYALAANDSLRLELCRSEEVICKTLHIYCVSSIRLPKFDFACCMKMQSVNSSSTSSSNNIYQRN